jgi:hypothetical protein
VRPRGTSSTTRARRVARWALAIAGTVALAACASRRNSEGPGGPLSTIGKSRYLQKAIRSSNEGVILLPSSKAERVYELPRLNEIAHALREPAAACFLERAILTMEPTDDERGFAKVPEGQVKIRARIAPSGEVMSADVLESGFVDETMPDCISRAVSRQTFPQNKGGVAHYIDVVYWVSLGLQGDVHTEAYRLHVRREQASAAIRSRPCVSGRAPAGRYRIAGLNLVDRNGTTMINRVDAGDLPPDIRACFAAALRDLRLPPAPDAFVRPVTAQLELEVAPDGTVAVADEQWLHLIELEEAEQRNAAREALAPGDDDPQAAAPIVVDGIDRGEPPASDPQAPVDGLPRDTTDQAPPQPPTTPAKDPGGAGLKIDLRPRR